MVYCKGVSEIKGLKLDNTGDIVIKDNKIEMVEGNDLTTQTIKTVLGTNKGEWVFNPDEGINFATILGKGHTEDSIKDEIEQGLAQVDGSFFVTNFELSPGNNRRFTLAVTAQNSEGEEITVKEVNN